MRFRFHRHSGRLLVAIAAVAIATITAVSALAGHQPSGVESYTGCLVPSSGTTTKLAVGDNPASPCNAGQVQIHLSGGDITAVTAGSGLTGGGANGAVSLGVNFAGTGSATTAARSDHNHDSQYLALTGKAADSDKLDGIDSTGFLGATAKAADSDLFDGVDSTEFVRGKAGYDKWTVVHTASLLGPSVPGPFGGNVRTGCRASTSHTLYFYRNGGSPVSVFEQVDGGTPSFFTLGSFAATGNIEASIERRTWIITDETDSGEVDVWSRWNGASCDFIIHVSLGAS